MKSFMKVKDILPTNLVTLKVVLVLESPFKDEVNHKHPLAGSSGKIVTNYIKNRVTQNSIIRNFCSPLGCELKNLPNSELGIMNCSLRPLDEAVYKKHYSNSQLGKYNAYINAFNFIRKNQTGLKRRNPFHQKIESYLIQNFKNRMAIFNQANQSIIFVPCCPLAEKFLNQCTLPTQHVLFNRIPHPSRGWNSLNINAVFNNNVLSIL
jgi:hypothetical protein